jgi:hypothetical protein
MHEDWIKEFREFLTASLAVQRNSELAAVV